MGILGEFMSELTGFVLNKQTNYSEELLDKMIIPLKYNNNKLYKYKSNGAANFQFAKTVDTSIKPDNTLYKDNDIFLCFDGEIYVKDHNSLSIHDISRKFTFQKDFQFLNDYEGDFRIILYDYKLQKLYLVTDQIGLMPIYFFHKKGEFVFSSQIKSIIKSPLISNNIDVKALASIFTFGFILGNRTFFKDIHLIPGGSVLEYDIRKQKVTMTKYWDKLSLFTERGLYKEVPGNELVYLFKESVSSRVGSKEKFGISLSGGLDSRCILSVLEKEREIHSYTVGVKGCADEIIASEISKILRTKHSFVSINRENLRNLVSLVSEISYYSDGLYFSNELTEKFVLDYLSTANYDSLLRGHGGELIKSSLTYPVPGNKAVEGIKGIEPLVDYMMNPEFTVLGPLNAHKLFTDQFLQLIKEIPKQYLTESLQAAHEKLHPIDVIVYFFLSEYVQRKVVGSLNIFRTSVNVLNPFLDRSFLRSALKMPYNLRYDGQIQKNIVMTCHPELAKIPNVNTGAPLGAGKLRTFITEKFLSVMKRLGMHGFRHYTEFEKWQRNTFKKDLEDCLFDKRTISRGLYKEDGLKKIFKLHIDGKKNYSRLLGTIVGVEVWFRNFVD